MPYLLLITCNSRWQFMADMHAKRQQLKGFQKSEMECMQTLGESQAARRYTSLPHPTHASISKSRER